MNLYEKPDGVQTRWFSPENPNGERGQGGLVNRGSKGRPYIKVPAGDEAVLMYFQGSGTICRIWMTINDRSPEMLRGLRIEMFWDGSDTPAVSAPFGDFFGIGLGRRTAFECAFFSDAEGRSFNCFIPMPFRTAARVVVTNESGKDLDLLFYDIDVLTEVSHPANALYFHACWRRESPNELGKEFAILPKVVGNGRFLGCNIGVITDERYGKAWWGEGEVKIRFAGEEGVTLCGTGTEDYIGTAWGQGYYVHRTQGCSIADDERRHWAFYRYHVDDPVFFDGACEVTIQTIGGTAKKDVIGFIEQGVPLIPTTVDAPNHGMLPLMDLPQPVDISTVGVEGGWCNFWRQDDWSAVAYFYMDSPVNGLPALASAAERIAGLQPPT